MLKHWRQILFSAAAILAVLVARPQAARADAFHYNGNLIGERAAGLAGAFTAIADDSSGAWYNPAGLPNATSDSVSVSLSIFQIRRQKFENAYKGKDWDLSSFNIIGASSGTVFKYGDWVFAFTVITPDYDEKEGRFQHVESPPILHMAYYEKSSEIFAGPSLAYRVHPSVCLGMTVYAYYRTGRVISSTMQETNGRFSYVSSQADRSYLGLAPVMGIWFRPLKVLRLGLALKSGFNAAGSTEFHDAATTNDPNRPASEVRVRTIPENLAIPFSFRLGAAYNPTRVDTVVVDISVHDRTDHVLAKGAVHLRPVVNTAVGYERRIQRWYTVRAGAYTDFSALPRETVAALDAAPSIDLFGVSAAFGWEDPLSTSMLGLNGAYGEGPVSIFNRRTAAKEYYVGILWGGSLKLDTALTESLREEIEQREAETPETEDEPVRINDIIHNIQSIDEHSDKLFMEDAKNSKDQADGKRDKPEDAGKAQP